MRNCLRLFICFRLGFAVMEPKGVSCEEIIAFYAGDCGLWQIRTLLVAALVKMPSAWQMGSILFTAIEPKEFWCMPPEQLNPINTDTWKNISHPKKMDHRTGEETWDPCFIYVFNYTRALGRSAILPVLNDIPVRRCSRFAYDSAFSIVTKWDLVCDRKVLINISQFFYLLGMLFGTILASYAVEKYGPRIILIRGMIFQIIFGVGAAFSPFLEIKFLMRFLVACSCSHMIGASYVICTDIVTSKTKIIFACCYEKFWSLGLVSLAIWSYFLPNWIELQVALSIPTFVILLFFKWIPESPQWLLKRGRYEEAEELFKEAAKLNKRKIPDLDIKKSFPLRIVENANWLEFVKSHNLCELSSLHLSWALTFIIYYGSVMNLKSLGEHLKAITILSGLCEMIGISIGLFLVLKTKQKWLILGSVLVIDGLLTGLCWFIPKKPISKLRAESMMVALGLSVRGFAAASFTLLLSSSAESFQPRFRYIALQSCLVFGKSLMLFVPFVEATAAFGANVMLSTYGAFMVATGISKIIFHFFSRT